jgi:PAS domain S-box-containing protein
MSRTRGISILPTDTLKDCKMEPLDHTRPAMAETFFDTLRQPACINSYKGQFLAANAALTAALGWTEEELRGLAYYDLVAPSEQKSLIRLGALIVRHAGSEPRVYRRAFRHKDGSYRLIEWTAWADPKTSLVCAMGRVLGSAMPR